MSLVRYVCALWLGPRLQQILPGPCIARQCGPGNISQQSLFLVYMVQQESIKVGKTACSSTNRGCSATSLSSAMCSYEANKAFAT